MAVAEDDHRLAGVIVGVASLSLGVASARAWRDHTPGPDHVRIEGLDRAALRPGPDVGAEPVAPAAAPAADAPADTPTLPEALQHPDQPAAPTVEPAPPAASPTPAVGREAPAIVAEALRRWGGGGLLLAIPRLGVTAAVSGLGYEADGRTPASPTSAWGVGWYQFTAYPGSGGNAVLSGHVDWYTGAPAVFAGLGAVGAGDSIYAVLPNGTPLTYQVTSAQWVQPATADVASIFGATSQEALTLITCGGAWDPVAQDYSHRLIVRAYRVR